MEIRLEFLRGSSIIRSENDVIHINKEAHENIVLSINKEGVVGIGTNEAILTELTG